MVEVEAHEPDYSCERPSHPSKKEVSLCTDWADANRSWRVGTDSNIDRSGDSVIGAPLRNVLNMCEQYSYQAITPSRCLSIGTGIRDEVLHGR